MADVGDGFKIGLGVILALVVAFVVLPVVGCLACGFCAAAADYTGEDRSASAAPAPAPPQPSGPRQTFSVVTFRGVQIDECVATTVAAPGQSTPQASAAVTRSIAAMREAMAQRSTVLDGSCADAFEGRTILASCTIQEAGTVDGVQTRMTSTASFYSFETVGGGSGCDRHMRDCIEEGGQWVYHLQPGSPEWRRVSARRSAGCLQESSALKGCWR